MMAAACGSLLPENSSLLETTFSSWSQIMALKQTEQHSTFTQIFGELRFKESASSRRVVVPPPLPSSSSLSNGDDRSFSIHRKSNSESLQLCTEGLGYESLDDVEDLEGGVLVDDDDQQQQQQVKDYDDDEKKHVQYPPNLKLIRTKSASVDDFPPPISCMGKTGKPWAGFKSYRYGGRFILKEVRVPTHEFLHASRENGRLKLHILVPNDKNREAKKDDNHRRHDHNHDHPDSIR